MDIIKRKMPTAKNQTGGVFYLQHSCLLPSAFYLTGDIATITRQIFAELAIEKGWDILALEVAPDHIHLFISVKLTDTPHLVIKAFKGRSSYYLRKEFPQLKKLPSLWTSSYFVSTASNISSEAVRRYIEDPHHG